MKPPRLSFQVESVIIMRKRHSLPGFGLTLGYTLIYLCIIVLIPLSALLLNLASGRLGALLGHDLRAACSYAHYWVSFGISFAAAIITAYSECHHRVGAQSVTSFRAASFSMPWWISHFALADRGRGYRAYRPLRRERHRSAHCSSRWASRWRAQALATTLASARFFDRPAFRGPHSAADHPEISLPVWRKPPATLGANRWQTFWKVIFPALLPSILTGVTLSFGRAVGEFGSVVFISARPPVQDRRSRTYLHLP